MKKTKRFLALLLALVMTASLAACNTAQSDPSSAPSSPATGAPENSGAPDQSAPPASDGAGTVAPITPEELGSGTVKWAEERTPDGWTQVTNEGGKTLGYSTGSGVSLIQVDGYAFKDLDRDGMLDGYEDWRNDAETRAADLAAHMTGEQIGPMLTHGGWASFGNEIEEGSTDYEYILAGGRAGVTRSTGSEGNTTMAVAWNNALQKLCESQDLGIPATISIDPNHISGVIDQLSLSTTFNTDTAFEAGKQMAEYYRAVGVTMLLGPQIDLIGTPVFARASGTFSEDPALTRDLTEAFVSGLQSTYDENGNDLGWGEGSVVAIMKHYAGAGAGEGGRNDHNTEAKYTVFPNGNFEAHLIGFFDGAFNLKRSSTGKAAGLMTNYATAYSADGSLGDVVAGAYSKYKMDLLEAGGWDGFIVTDWGVAGEGERIWGMEEYTTAERHAIMYKQGINQVGGSSDVESPVEAFDLLVEELGEEEATALYRKLAAQFFVTQINCNLFENPYITTKNATAKAWSNESMAKSAEVYTDTIIMLKNSGGVIGAASGEKKTVYIPYVFDAGSEATSSADATPPSWNPSFDLDIAGKYFNVVTDTVGDPTGEADADGNPTYTENDIVRASASDLASCDMALVYMHAAKTDGAVDEEGNMLPASLQYEAYTATTARKESIAGDMQTETINDGYYGTKTQTVKENWSYAGNSVPRDANYTDYEMLQYVASAVPGSCKVVAMLAANGPMVMSEVDPLADAILYYFAGNSGTIFGGAWFDDSALMQIVAGEAEPSALLPFQMPASMEAVEAQDEDTVRDCECYVDADGNTYDFAFGLNWSGVINDERVQTYAVDPLTECENLDFFYAN